MCDAEFAHFVVFSSGVQRQFVRYRRLIGWRPDRNPWRVPVYDKKQSMYKQELTEENEAFLEQTVLDTYQEKMKESVSPLKDGPWQRSEWTVGYVKLKLTYIYIYIYKENICRKIIVLYAKFIHLQRSLSDECAHFFIIVVNYEH